MYLEKYLLSMYRKTFAKRLESLDDTTETNSAPKERKNSQVKKHNSIITNENSTTNNSPLPPFSNPSEECNERAGDPSLVDTSILRCHSSLSHTAAASFKPSPLARVLADAVDSYHSLPLSMLEVRNARESTVFSGSNMLERVKSLRLVGEWTGGMLI